MWSEYPLNGSATTFIHFECVIKFVMPFTIVVMNGWTMTSLIVWIFPFTTFRSYSGTFRPFIVFLLEITVLRCTCFQVSPACCNSFSGHSHNQMVYDQGTYLHRYPSPYLWSKMTKNNTSSLYQGKSGIVRLASMYHLCSIKCPHPQDTTHPLSNSSVEGSSTPFPVQNLSVCRQRFGTQYPPVPSPPPPSTTTIAISSQVAIPRDQGCDTRILPPVCWYLLASLAPLHLVVHVLGVHWRCLLPPPNFHLKGCLDTH